jgi:hypothetical protein
VHLDAAAEVGVAFARHVATGHAHAAFGTLKKMFWVKKKLGGKTFWVDKMFWVKKGLGEKKFCVKNTFWVEKYLLSEKIYFV